MTARSRIYVRKVATPCGGCHSAAGYSASADLHAVTIMTSFGAFLSISSIFLIICGGCAESKEYQYSTGPFSITYDLQALPSLQIKWESKAIWFSSPSSSSKPILYAEKVSTKEEQIGGDYTVKTKVLDSCLKLNVTTIGSRPGGQGEQIVFLLGKLCGKVDTDLTFQAVTLLDHNDITGRVSNVTHLQFQASMAENSFYNSLRLVYGCDEEEKFYGFGAQYSRLNMKGQRLPLFLSEQGVGRGLEPVTFILDTFSRNAGNYFL